MTLSCKVCWINYEAGTREPVSLQCGHSFCRKCLITLQDTDSLKCPSCKVPHYGLPVQQLPTNSDLLTISIIGSMPSATIAPLTRIMQEATPPLESTSHEGQDIPPPHNPKTMTLLVVVKETEPSLDLSVRPTIKVKDVQVKLRVTHGVDCGWLEHRGLVLEDGRTLKEQGVLPGATLRLHDPRKGKRNLAGSLSPCPLPPLLDFASRGKLDPLKEELDGGCDVNMADPKTGRTALHLCCAAGYVSITTELLHYEANVHAKDHLGQRPLHLAAREGNHDLLPHLLQKGALLEAQDNQGRRALHLAARGGHTDTLKALERHGCYLSAVCTTDGCTALHLAAVGGHLEAAAWLVDQGISTSARDHLHNTAKDQAKKGLHQEVVNYLHQVQSHGPLEPQTYGRSAQGKKEEKGQETNPQSFVSHYQKPSQYRYSMHKEVEPQEFKEKPLKNEAKYGDEVKPQLTHKSQGNTQSRNEKTKSQDSGISTAQPQASTGDLSKSEDNERLLEAAGDGDVWLVKQLVEDGICLEGCSNNPGEEGLRAVHLAAWGGYEEVLEVLLEAGAEAGVQAAGRQAVHWAAVGGHVGVLNTLQKHGCDICALTTDGSTALHLAAEQGNLEACRWLVEEGKLEVNVRDRTGHTAGDLAEAGHFSEVLDYLKGKPKEQSVMVLREGRYGKVRVETLQGFKLIHKQMFMGRLEPSQRSEVLLELRAWDKIKSAFIADHWVQEEGQLIHIFSSYCEGENLEQRITEQKYTGEPFPQYLVHSWALMLTLALKYLHSRQLLHANVRPANIFFTGSGALTLGNLGRGRLLLLPQDHQNTSISFPAEKYTSPEVRQGGAYSTPADMWALGCCLYEIAALFSGYPYSQKVTVPGDLSTAYKSLVISLLDPCPENRPSATQVLKNNLMKKTLKEQLEDKTLLKLYQDVNRHLAALKEEAVADS